MGATYTRQSSGTIVDGSTIEAAHFNNEFDQLLAAFAVSSGHTHDGTAAEGGPITKLLGTAITIGDATSGTDIAMTFDGESNDGVLTWMEDEDYFQFSDDLLLSTTEKLQFRDTAIYINSSTDGQLDLVADTEIQIAATTIDINGNVDVSGTLTVAGAVDFGDAALSNVGAVQLDSITGDGDTNTSITFSGSDVITVATGGAGRLTIGDGALSPVTNNQIDLGTSSLEFKDAFFDGTVTADAFAGPLTGNVTGNVSGTAATVTTAAQSNITSLGTLTTLTVDNVITNGATIGHTSDTDLLTLADGVLTIAGDLVVSGDDITMGTNTSGHILVADGTNFNPVAVTDLSAISTVASGDTLLAVDASGGGLKKIARSVLVAGLATSSALNNVSEDDTPQLGGNLDMNGSDIVTTSNATIDLAPNGTGTVVVRGNSNSGAIVFNCESNSHGQTIIAQPHSASATNTMLLPEGANSTLVSLVSTDTLTNKTLTSPKVNEDVAVTSTATELNALDGITAVVGELNALDIGATAIGTAVASKAVILDANKDYTGLRNFTVSGELDAATGDFSGNVDVDGTLEADAITINGTAIASVLSPIAGGSGIVTTGALDAGSITSGFGAIDNGTSGIRTNTFTAETSFVPDAQDGAALGTTSLQFSDLFLADGAVVGFGDNNEVTLTHVHDAGLLLNSTMKLQFNDATQFVQGISATVLGLGATDEIDLTATLVDVNANLDVSGTITSGGIITGTAFTAGSAVLAEAELELLDGITAGTTAASKVFTADSNNVTAISGAVVLTEDTLSFDATQDWDVRASPVAKVTLTANVTFDAPSNPTTGQYISVICIQDGTGSRTIAWNAVFEFAGDETPTATTTAAKGDLFTFRYNGAKWLEVGRNFNLTLS